MDTVDEEYAVVVPHVSYEERIWHVPGDVYVSRSERNRQNGSNKSTIPIKLQSISLNFPPAVVIDMERAVARLSQLNTYATSSLRRKDYIGHHTSSISLNAWEHRGILSVLNDYAEHIRRSR